MLDIAHLGGIVPPIATPLNADETVDEAGLRRLVRHVLDGGVHGIFALGTTGEFATLPDEERRKAAEIVMSEVAGRVPVFVGTGACSTGLAIRQAKMAEEVGAAAIVAVLPYYYFLGSKEEQIVHFEGLLKETSLPMLMYNIPQCTKHVVRLDVVEHMRGNSQVAGIKDSSDDYRYFRNLPPMAGAAFRVFQGSEALAGPSLLMRANGAVLGIANLAPRLCVRLWDAAQKEDAAAVREIQRTLDELNKIYFFEGTSTVGGLKAALSMIGICQPYVTRPLAPASASARARIEAEVKRFREQF
jgi:dihydrodipicolinate synthase/N-acetylneuraminate lyase